MALHIISLRHYIILTVSIIPKLNRFSDHSDFISGILVYLTINGKIYTMCKVRQIYVQGQNGLMLQKVYDEMILTSINLLSIHILTDLLMPYPLDDNRRLRQKSSTKSNISSLLTITSGIILQIRNFRNFKYIL